MKWANYKGSPPELQLGAIKSHSQCTDQNIALLLQSAVHAQSADRGQSLAVTFCALSVMS